MTQPRYTVNCSILLTDIPLLERPRAARAAGFDGVEFWWPFATSTPEQDEVDAFVGAIKDAGVELTGLNFNAGDMPGGDRGLVSWPARSQEFRDNLDVVTRIGEATGCSDFNALYGNRVEGAAPAEQDELGAENLALAAQAVADRGTVLVEPVSGAPAIRSKPRPTRSRDRPAGEENIRAPFDVFHLAVNGDDVDAAREAYRADRPRPDRRCAGRDQPGTGELPIARWISDLTGGGYEDGSGWSTSPPPTNPPLTHLPGCLRTSVGATSREGLE